MLPSLTAGAIRRPRRRTALGLVVAVLLFVAALSARPVDGAPVQGPAALADRLAPSSWAVAVPVSWLAAPLPGLRTGDRIDLLAVRPGERATASAIAFDLEVMSFDDRALVVDAGAEDATALAVARGGGLLIVPLLRSTR